MRRSQVRRRFAMLMGIGFAIGCLICTASGLSAAPNLTPATVWRLTRLDDARGVAVCLPDRSALFRVGIPAARCSHQMFRTERREWVVEFSCERLGLGRSVFREVGGRTMRIETQGLIHGQPFAVDYEARETGSCTAGS